MGVLCSCNTRPCIIIKFGGINMAGIRVKSGLQKIEVNDKGDFIVLKNDIGFLTDIKDLLSSLSKVFAEVGVKAKDLDDSDVDVSLDLLYEAHKKVHDGIDNVFGVGTCMKVFGDGEVDTIPSLDLVFDFFDQLTPHIEKIGEALTVSTKKVGKRAEAFTQAGGISLDSNDARANMLADLESVLKELRRDGNQSI